MQKLRMAVLGAGGISRRVCAGVQNSTEFIPYRIGARDLSRSKAVGEEYGFVSFSQGYDDLLLDDIDAVYITTIDRLHKEHIRLCLEHGKHVICEKPMLTHMDELDELYALADEKGLVLMEAMKAIYLPTLERTKELLAEQEGELLYLYVPFCRYHPFTQYPIDSFLFDPIHGGALRDVGSYSMSWALEFLQDKELTHLDITQKIDERGCDRSTNLQLSFADGTLAHILSSLEFTLGNQAILAGRTWQIHVRNYWKSLDIELYQNDKLVLHEKESFKSEFSYQIDAFARFIRRGEPQKVNAMLKAKLVPIVKIYEQEFAARKR